MQDLLFLVLINLFRVFQIILFKKLVLYFFLEMVFKRKYFFAKIIQRFNIMFIKI